MIIQIISLVIFPEKNYYLHNKLQYKHRLNLTFLFYTKKQPLIIKMHLK